jgi:hypothetical protein
MRTAPFTVAVPETTSKRTGSPEDAVAFKMTGWPAAALVAPWKEIVWLLFPTVTRARSLVELPSGFVATTS